MWRTFQLNPKIIIFGMLTAFFSGPGQTFLVSLFIPDMARFFGLRNAEVGGIYASATLVGALLLPYLGRLLDRTKLLAFTLLMGTCLLSGCLVLGFSTRVFWLYVGFALIRSFGQGAMTLTASATAAKYFAEDRGKALSWVSLGHPLSSAFFPLMITYWIDQYGWRHGWQFLAGLIVVMYLPAVLILLRGQDSPDQRGRTPRGTPPKDSLPQISYKTLFKHPAFLPGMLVSMVMPFLLTGLFLYQAKLAEAKGWSMEFLAMAFIAFSICRAAASLSTGFIVDHLTARRVFSWFLVPLLLGVLVLYFAQSPFWAFVYLGFCGLAVGMGMVIRSAFWAELFGSHNLGAIKGISGFFGTFATALSPPLLGFLMDTHVPIKNILLMIVFLAFFGVLLALLTSYLAKSNK